MDIMIQIDPVDEVSKYLQKPKKKNRLIVLLHFDWASYYCERTPQEIEAEFMYPVDCSSLFIYRKQLKHSTGLFASWV